MRGIRENRSIDRGGVVSSLIRGQERRRRRMLCKQTGYYSNKESSWPRRESRSVIFRVSLKIRRHIPSVSVSSLFRPNRTMRLTSALLAGAILEGCGLIRLHATAETTVTYPTTSIYRTTYSIVVPTTTASYYNAKATTVNDSPAVYGDTFCVL